MIYAILEGRPITDGSILFDLDGLRWEAKASNHRDYCMNLHLVQPGDFRTNKWWLTNTHWEGRQILYWGPPPKHLRERWIKEKLRKIASKPRGSHDQSPRSTDYRTRLSSSYDREHAL